MEHGYSIMATGDSGMAHITDEWTKGRKSIPRPFGHFEFFFLMLSMYHVEHAELYGIELSIIYSEINEGVIKT